jgi:mono/diheme cytochrome c family protein
MRRPAPAAAAATVMPGVALALVLAVAPVVVRAADPPADAEHGRALARTWCAQCHNVERGAQQRADGVPSFTALANDPRNTTDHLRAFLTRPHGRMPDLSLSRQERDDLIAYLTGLRDGGAAPSPTAPAPRRP